MRLAGILAALALICVAAFQSVIGGAPDGEADTRIVLADSDFCTVEAATLPVVVTETRDFVIVPAHKELSVTPARFGTRTETVTIVPEHHEGATFFAEPKRVIVSEPTRRLRAIEPVIEIDPVFDARDVIRPRVEGGELIETTESLPPLPESYSVLSDGSIQAVRINAGLKMLDTRIIDTDGEGALVPAETIEIEVRTVETKPAVETHEVAAVTETAEFQKIETQSSRVDVAAVCSMAGKAALIGRVEEVLTAKGIEIDASGEWSASTIDAVAAAQTAETGLVSPHLLLETLRLWLPDLALPAS